MLPLPSTNYVLRMPRQAEALTLHPAGTDAFGRPASLAPDTAEAWCAMRDLAAQGGIHLLLISGFRSVARQTEIIQSKLNGGLLLENILQFSAYPGHSEHHTGRAIDVGSPHCEHLSEAFENTSEFAWLSAHAYRHGFIMSYPRGNAHGIAYEPWHWRHQQRNVNAPSSAPS